jgi:nitroreductase
MSTSKERAMSESPAPGAFADARREVLEDAADSARHAPSVHNTQPWTLRLAGDRLLLRADRSRQLLSLDPLGRELVLSVGAALLNARVALAAHGWAMEVHRLPDPDDPDLLAELRPITGRPDGDLAALERLIPRRHTNRRRFDQEPMPGDVLDRLAGIAAAEGAVLGCVDSDADRRLVARLTQEADRLQNADPAYRAELRHWTTRPASSGDGVPPAAVPRAEGRRPGDLPLRDFDTTGRGTLPADPSSDIGQTILVVATETDEPHAWLRAGEAMERLLLELTLLGWVASPVTQALEVPATRAALRDGLTAGRHPQVLLRVGHAAATISVPRRRRDEVVQGSRRRTDRVRSHVPAPPPDPAVESEPRPHRPVSDGRGGTIWI